MATIGATMVTPQFGKWVSLFLPLLFAGFDAGPCRAGGPVTLTFDHFEYSFGAGLTKPTAEQTGSGFVIAYVNGESPATGTIGLATLTFNAATASSTSLNLTPAPLVSLTLGENTAGAQL